jgi:head-tail adaptor
MRGGNLNRRVRLERKVETPSGTGGSTIAWETIATVWADIRYLSGLETSKSNFPLGVARASIRIRRRGDVDPTCRAVYLSNGDTTVFEILAVLPDTQGREYVDLSAQTGANSG